MKHDPLEPAAWTAGAAVTPGSRHVRMGTGCQDRAVADTPPSSVRTYVAVCDGRGSSDVSQLGAEAAVAALRKAVRVLDPHFAEALDRGRSAQRAAQRWSLVAASLLRWLMHEQVELARARQCEPRAFDFTLAAVFRGRRFAGWIQVGDASAVVAHGAQVALLGSPGRGEYANETQFVHPADETLQAASWGVVPAAGLTAVGAFTDGVGRGLVDLRTGLPGKGIGQIFARLASAEWDAGRLQRYLEDPKWLLGGDDDRAFAYAVRAEPPAPAALPSATPTEPDRPAGSEAGQDAPGLQPVSAP